MPEPITMDIPHTLGLAAARKRLADGVGQIAGMAPGGSLKSHRWEGDTLFFELEALGQRVAAKLEVFDTRIHAVVDLPPMAAMFASTIRARLGRIGTNLLR